MNMNILNGNRAKAFTLMLSGFVLLLLLAGLPPHVLGHPQSSLASDAIAASSGAAEESTWTGKVQQKSVGGAMAFVLVTGGESFLLSPQDNLASLDGKNVSVKGTLKDGVITITSIEEVN
ncbi:MAG: hypothetical protein MUF01_08525 [Bryobacterales bacterium]|nr:hypothetical protein [Bryobacterales bacterium]